MKKFLCMMMAVLMVLAMAACGDEPANNGGNDTPDATTVKIGGIGPLTGAYANYGLSEKNGAELAVKEINEAGGIAGKQIELSYQDSQGESESAVNAYGKLMDWGMEVSLGCVLSGENASVVAAARDDDVLLITPSGSADKCIDGNDKAFRVCFYDSYQGAAAAQYIKDNNMVDTVGILYQSDNDYSVGLYNAFVAKCGEPGHHHRRDPDLHLHHQHRFLHPGQCAGRLRCQAGLHPHLCGRSFHLPHPGSRQVRR